MDTLQYLNERVNYLENKLDSIQILNDFHELNIKLNEQANIISNVGDFYENAWLKLVIVISILGIIIPILIQYFQRNSLKQLTSFLSKEIKESFELRINELTNTNSNQINQLSAKINSEMNLLKSNYELMSNEIEASLYYLQGKQSLSNRKYASALNDFKRSTEYWLKSTKPNRIGVILTNIEICIKNLKTKIAFNQALSDFEINWTEFSDTIKTADIYHDKVKSIKTIISKLE